MADDTNDQGFDSNDDDRQREIASKGDPAAHESGNADEFTPETAAEAGRKGGEAGSGTSRGGSQDTGGDNTGIEQGGIDQGGAQSTNQGVYIDSDSEDANPDQNIDNEYGSGEGEEANLGG